MRYLALFIAFMAARGTVACAPEEGILHLEVTWADGYPDFATPRITPHAWTKVLDGDAVVSQSARQPLSIGDISLREIPYREGMRARVEVLDGPWANARVLFAGESGLFDFEPGVRVRRRVTLSPVDEAGSSSVTPLAMDRVVYERAPWGRAMDDPGLAELEARVVGAPGTAPQGAVEAIVFSSAEVAQAEILARVSVTPEGGFELTFSRSLSSEADRVALAFADGRQSLTDTSTAPGLQAAWIRRTRWFANLREKVLGSTFPNPHTLKGARTSPAHRWPDRSVEIEIDDGGLEAVVWADGAMFEARGTPAWERLIMDRPSSRTNPLLAYDEERGELVLLWGQDIQRHALDDVWRWSRSGWRSVDIIGKGPRVRRNAAFVFHRRMGGLLLFGGTADLGPKTFFLNDLWLLRGSDWSPVAAVGLKPSARGLTAHAYDRRRGRLVIFGGCGAVNADGTGCTTVLDELWAFDGTAWTLLEPEGSKPSPRYGGALAYDAVGDRLFLFGGGAEFGVPRDDAFWVLDPQTLSWTEVPLGADGPPPHTSVQAVFDPDRRRLLLASGWVLQQDPVPAQVPVGMWAWDGEHWSRPRSELDLPDLAFGGWAWHAGLRAGVSFGGSLSPGEDAQSLSIIWDGETTQTLGTIKLEPYLTRSAAATDPKRRRIVLFGGLRLNNLAPSDSTWVFDGLAWQRETLPGPGARSHHAMTHFPPLDGVLLLGGVDSEVNFLSDAWVFDGVWRSIPIDAEGGNLIPLFGSAIYETARQRGLFLTCFGMHTLNLDPASGKLVVGRGDTRLPARYDAAVVYDEANERTVVVGGRSCLSGERLAEVWSLSKAGVWTLLATPSEFPPLSGATAVYHPGRSVVVIYGGVSAEGKLGIDDVWELDGSTFSRPRLSRSAPKRLLHVGAFDHVNGRILFAGGIGIVTDPGVTVMYDGNGFEALEMPTSPGPRCDHRATYRSKAREGLLFGGCSQGTFDFDDGCQAVGGTWIWTGYGWSLAKNLAEPEPRAYPVLATHPISGTSWLLGGEDGRGLVESVWVWDGRSWRRQARGAELTSASAAWDPEANVLFGFGGYRAATDVGPEALLGTWTWDPVSGWRDSPSSVTPRSGSAVVYNQARGELFAFGGAHWVGPDSGETCIRRQGPWVCRLLGGPEPRSQPQVVYDSVRGRVVLLGGFKTTEPFEIYEDVWEWTGDAWRLINAPGFEQLFPAMLYDPLRRGLVVHGGDALGNCDDRTGFLGLDPNQRPEIRFSVDFGSTREAPESLEHLQIHLVAGARGFELVPGHVGQVTSGGTVEAWDASQSAWRELGRFDFDILAPRELVIETTQELPSLVTADGKVELRFRPLSGNGSGLEPSSVGLDAIEARFDYRW